MSNYSDQWRNPRWQKKRLETMERDGFECKNCGTKEKELSVHHLYYEKRKKPWEYSEDALITFCTKCHEEWHRLKELLDKRPLMLNAELEWLLKCAEIGPHRSIKARFRSDTEITIKMLTHIVSEAIKRDDRGSSQIVDCCLLIKELLTDGAVSGYGK